MKTFLCSSVWLSGVPDAYRGNNGSCQFTIVVRAKTKKRVRELLDCSNYTLNDFYGCHVAGKDHASIPQKDEVIYYKVEQSKIGWINKWFEYSPTTR